MMFRSAGLLLVLALAVTGCTRTAMYHPPGDDDPRARLSIESLLGSNEESSGWQMPGAGESTVAIFKVDGERLAEKGGEHQGGGRPRGPPVPHRLLVTRITAYRRTVLRRGCA